MSFTSDFKQYKLFITDWKREVDESLHSGWKWLFAMYMQWETCFENEAKANSKMAFYVSLNISNSLSHPFGSIGLLFFMNFCLNMATDPGGTAIHVLYICRCEGYDFQAVYSSIGCTGLPLIRTQKIPWLFTDLKTIFTDLALGDLPNKLLVNPLLH